MRRSHPFHFIYNLCLLINFILTYEVFLSCNYFRNLIIYFNNLYIVFKLILMFKLHQFFICYIIFRKLKRDGFSNGKKAYTEHELLAAVHDIRSGKIGTRRASVLYGIPRSTLRNKIFKMDNEQKNLNLEAENEADNLSEEPSARIERTMCLNDLMSQPSMFSFMPPLPFGLTFSTESNSKSTEEWEKKLEHIRKKHNLSGDRTEIYNGQHSVADMSDGKMNHTSCLPFNHELKLPILPELVKKLTGERLQMEHGFDHIRNSLKTSVGYNEPNNSCEPVQTKSHSLVNLKIPSYKSVKAEDTIPSNIKDSKPYENSRIGETLKNIIAKTITEKVRSRNLSSSFESFQPFPGAPQDTSAHQNQGPGSSAFSVPCASPPKRQKRCTDIPKKSQGSVKNCMSPLPSTPVKKTRPKRGQYRKYNSQLLMEAVRAVQRGEMSVHRAGSYFGVPHSTLEYKVKERHLLRQKKIKEAQALKDAGNGSNTTSANSSDEEEANISPCKPTEEQARPLSPTNQASASEWLKLYSSNIPPVSANNMAFYNSGFALNTPASELLRKLQHKVQSKANNYRGDDGFSAGTVPAPNGIGPLGGGFLFLN